jgi:hypothetical protein
MPTVQRYRVNVQVIKNAPIPLSDLSSPSRWTFPAAALCPVSNQYGFGRAVRFAGALRVTAMICEFSVIAVEVRHLDCEYGQDFADLRGPGLRMS